MDYERKILSLLQVAVSDLQRCPKDYDYKMQWTHYLIFAQCLTNKEYFIDKTQDIWKVVAVEKDKGITDSDKKKVVWYDTLCEVLNMGFHLDKNTARDLLETVNDFVVSKEQEG